MLPYYHIYVIQLYSFNSAYICAKACNVQNIIQYFKV